MISFNSQNVQPDLSTFGNQKTSTVLFPFGTQGGAKPQSHAKPRYQGGLLMDAELREVSTSQRPEARSSEVRGVSTEKSPLVLFLKSPRVFFPYILRYFKGPPKAKKKPKEFQDPWHFFEKRLWKEPVKTY